MKDEKKRELLGVQLEITSLCNFKCLFCPVSQYGKTLEKSQRKFIDPETVYKVLDAIKDISMTYFSFSFIAESMMNPKLFDYIQYSNRYDIPVVLVTNGTLFTEKHWEMINGVKLKGIKISLQTADPDSFQKMRGTPISYEQYLAKIDLVLKARQQNLFQAPVYLDIGFNPFYTFRNRVLGTYHGDKFIERSHKKLAVDIKKYLQHLTENGIGHSHGKLTVRDLEKKLKAYWRNYGLGLEDKVFLELDNGINISLKAFWDHFVYDSNYPVKRVNCHPDKMVIDIDGDVHICNRDIMKKTVVDNIYKNNIDTVIANVFEAIDNVACGDNVPEFCHFCQGYPTRRGRMIANLRNWLYN